MDCATVANDVVTNGLRRGLGQGDFAAGIGGMRRRAIVIEQRRLPRVNALKADISRALADIQRFFMPDFITGTVDRHPPRAANIDNPQFPTLQEITDA